MHQGFLPPCDLLHQPRRDVHIEAANCTNIESWAGQKMQCAGAGAQHEQCSLHHILMVQSGACLPHCYLWPHERSPHLWPSFTALLRRASKQKRLCVPAAALWSGWHQTRIFQPGAGHYPGWRCSMMMLAGARGRGSCSLGARDCKGISQQNCYSEFTSTISPPPWTY